jgi:hypothetical protein
MEFMLSSSLLEMSAITARNVTKKFHIRAKLHTEIRTDDRVLFWNLYVKYLLVQSLLFNAMIYWYFPLVPQVSQAGKNSR